ncbi:Dolichyl-phosphate-mannose-protein mannosyltransferase [Streptomyces sp. KS_16]|nr:Dolichyl-phosphate-mannose-protein mannosyltransferase [Streptomyces sp. KS_16]
MRRARRTGRAAPGRTRAGGLRGDPAAGSRRPRAWSTVNGKDWHTLLAGRWDALWYTRVAEQGYGYTVQLPHGAVHSDLAFFPLLPSLERGLPAVVPLSPADAGLVVSWLASLAAACALYATGERLHGHRAGVALAALWAAVPVGIVQSMAYSESLFTALAAWALYAVLTGRWVWAGVLASLAGLTRPVGAAVVAAVWVTAAVTLGRQRTGGVRGRAALRAQPGLLPGVLLAPLGWCGYFLWVAARQGSLTGYLDVQAGWGNGFDGGIAFGAFLGELLSGPSFAAGLGLLLGVGLLIWLYLRGVRQGQPLPLAVYGGTVLLLALTAKGYFGSKPRLMLPAYPLLLPLAAGLARRNPVRSWLVVGLVAAGSAVYGAFWLNGSGPP